MRSILVYSCTGVLVFVQFLADQDHRASRTPYNQPLLSVTLPRELDPTKPDAEKGDVADGADGSCNTLNTGSSSLDRNEELAGVHSLRVRSDPCRCRNTCKP